MMDALGLRGRWRRHKHEDIVRKLLFLKSDADAYHAHQTRGETGPTNVIDYARVQCLSDTIILTVTTRSPPAVKPAFSPEQVAGHAVDFAMQYASRIMQLALETAIPFAYRGCVSYGGFHNEDNFIVGEAADEAAGYYEKAEGAFVWCLPSALDAFERDPSSRAPNDPRRFRFRVPMKGGASFETLVATPFFGLGTVPPVELARRLIETFDGPLDVRIKKQNTLPMIATASQYLEARRGQSQRSLPATVAALPVPPELEIAPTTAAT
jgi:hypothetical protein